VAHFCALDVLPVPKKALIQTSGLASSFLHPPPDSERMATAPFMPDPDASTKTVNKNLCDRGVQHITRRS